MYDELFFRNQGALHKEEQETLRRSRIAIIGLGGTGGYALENLLRIGVERFSLFDGDRFELTNMNRQLLCEMDSLDAVKSAVAAARAKKINPDVKAEAYGNFTKNDGAKMAGVNIVLDCTDNADAHVMINQACRKQKKPQVFAACDGAYGMVSVLKGYDIAKMFQLPKDRKTLQAYQRCTSILAPAAAMAGTLAAAQATAYLIGKPYAQAPRAVMFDLFKEKMVWESDLG